MSALPHFQTSICSATVSASSTSIPNSGLYSRSSYDPAGAERLEDFPSSCKLELPWSGEVNACHRSMDQGRSFRATQLTVLRTAAWSDGQPDRVQGRGMD